MENQEMGTNQNNTKALTEAPTLELSSFVEKYSPIQILRKDLQYKNLEERKLYKEASKLWIFGKKNEAPESVEATNRYNESVKEKDSLEKEIKKLEEGLLLTLEDKDLKRKLDIESYMNVRIMSPGSVTLDHTYGSSYFGSGGAYGNVKAYDLKDYVNGSAIKKEIKTKDWKDGFVEGVKWVEVEPNTIVICECGDSINGGRKWGEVYICE